MKFIGRCSDININHTLSISDENYGRLFCYAKENIEIIIYYRKEHPFYVEYIAVLIALTDTYATYDVYEYNYFSVNLSEVKQNVKSVVEEKIGKCQIFTLNDH